MVAWFTGGGAPSVSCGGGAFVLSLARFTPSVAGGSWACGCSGGWPLEMARLGDGEPSLFNEGCSWTALVLGLFLGDRGSMSDLALGPGATLIGESS